MSRPRSKPTPVPNDAQNYIDAEELEQRSKKIAKMWDDAGERVEELTADQAYSLALNISSFSPIQIDMRQKRHDDSVRAAVNTLLKWSRDPTPSDLPHAVIRSRIHEHLEHALLLAQPLVESPPARGWVNCAWSLWIQIKALRQGKAGVSQSSHAVRFVGAALRFAGHPAATDNAVSMELRNHPEFRKQLA